MTIQFGLARGPTPILNTPDFQSSFGGKDGKSIPFDERRLLRTIEAVALPRTKFTILGNTEHEHILKVSTRDYPYEGDFFIDERFLELTTEDVPERQNEPPPIPEIIDKLDHQVGLPYIWGGTWPDGVPELLEYYPLPSSPIDPLVLNTKQLRGFDCTGLLYYVSNGYTQRNSSSFVHWGKGVEIENLSIEEIVDQVEDLDAIVWKGHLICVYDKNTTIESFVGKGVIKTDLRERLKVIMEDKIPVNNYVDNSFVVRRWHPDSLVVCK